MKKITQNINIKACHAIGKLFCVLFSLSCSLAFSQIYVSGDAVIFTGSGTIVSGEIKTQPREARIYVKGKTTVYGIKEYTNAVATTSSGEKVHPKIKPGKIKQSPKQKLAKNKQSGVSESPYFYKADTEHSFGTGFRGTANVAVVNTFSYPAPSKAVFPGESSKINFPFFTFGFGVKKYGIELIFLDFLFSGSFRIRPPPCLYI